MLGCPRKAQQSYHHAQQLRKPPGIVWVTLAIAAKKPSVAGLLRALAATAAKSRADRLAARPRPRRRLPPALAALGHHAAVVSAQNWQRRCKVLVLPGGVRPAACSRFSRMRPWPLQRSKIALLALLLPLQTGCPHVPSRHMQVECPRGTTVALLSLTPDPGGPQLVEVRGLQQLPTSGPRVLSATLGRWSLDEIQLNYDDSNQSFAGRIPQAPHQGARLWVAFDGAPPVDTGCLARSETPPG
jgi:hypothetical protein